MTEPTRRRGAVPDAGAVADLTAPPAPAGVLTKAPEQDPVLAAARPDHRRRGATGAALREQLKVWGAPGLPGRLRAAFLATREETGYRSVSELVEHAIEVELRKLERKHHGGKPWEPVQPGIVPTGRPIGS